MLVSNLTFFEFAFLPYFLTFASWTSENCGYAEAAAPKLEPLHNNMQMCAWLIVSCPDRPWHAPTNGSPGTLRVPGRNLWKKNRKKKLENANWRISKCVNLCKIISKYDTIFDVGVKFDIFRICIFALFFDICLMDKWKLRLRRSGCAEAWATTQQHADVRMTNC